MVADEGFEPTDVATFEVAAYASFANLRNCSSGQPLATHQLLRCRFVAQALPVAMSENLW